MVLTEGDKEEEDEAPREHECREREERRRDGEARPLREERPPRKAVEHVRESAKKIGKVVVFYDDNSFEEVGE